MRGMQPVSRSSAWRQYHVVGFTFLATIISFNPFEEPFGCLFHAAHYTCKQTAILFIKKCSTAM
jgi:hypothetical protein